MVTAPTPAKFDTREAWLQAAKTAVLPLLKAAEVEVPDVHLSVGFPKGRQGRGGSKVVGQCWNGEISADGHPHVFVCPTQANPETVLAILVHELIHAAGNHGHQGEFGRAMKRVGMTRPWTHCTPGDELRGKLKVIAAELGTYPHPALRPTPKPKKTGRMRLFECACEVPQKVRWGNGKVDLQATCNVCNQPFTAK